MVAIVDYGVGNLFSLKSSFARVGAEVTVTGDPAVLHAADRIVLPGVGAFGDAAAKLRAAEKEKAANLKPELMIQYQDIEVNTADLVDAAKADFHNAKKRTLITDLKLYIKPEDRTAYYVINETFNGKIPF